jgi:hypothetical protein
MRNPSSRRFAVAALLFAFLATTALLQAGVARADDEGSDRGERAAAPEACAAGETLATGAADPGIFAREASRGVRAFWCETYDTYGNSRRAGPYWELHPDGSTRARARYVDGRIDGPVEIFDEEGNLWLRGELAGGAWTGPLEIFHPNGAQWLSARFEAGRLEGPVETRFPDGGIESSTRFQAGREHGIATSYYPAVAGGGLRSQVRVEADEIVEVAPASDASLSQVVLPDAPSLHAENHAEN